MLAEKLQMAGVITAFDVTGEVIQAIPGFGESKALSLIRWRESLENALRNSQPSNFKFILGLANIVLLIMALILSRR